VFASCTTGRGPNGSSAAQIRQARTSRNRRFSDIKELSVNIHTVFRVRGRISLLGQMTYATGMLTHSLVKELECCEPGDRSGLGPITPLVRGVLKRVTGAIVDFNFDSLSSSVHTPFKRSNLLGTNPPIESTEDS